MHMNSTHPLIFAYGLNINTKYYVLCERHKYMVLKFKKEIQVNSTSCSDMQLFS